MPRQREPLSPPTRATLYTELGCLAYLQYRYLADEFLRMTSVFRSSRWESAINSATDSPSSARRLADASASSLKLSFGAPEPLPIEPAASLVANRAGRITRSKGLTMPTSCQPILR